MELFGVHLILLVDLIGSDQIVQGEMRIRQCFGWKTEVKRELAKCRSRWQDDVKIDGKEISCVDVHLLSLVHDRGQWKAVVNTVTNIQRL